ncbi:hypothetical protein BH23GEM9_BH23GEM9_22620 [soil metagenome]
MTTPLASRLSFEHPLALDEFPYDPPPWGGLLFRGFSEDGAEVIFQQFADRVLDAIGRQWLPVYRMADGEFAFLVGPQSLSSGPLRAGLDTARVAWRRLRGAHLRTCWNEEYPRRLRKPAIARLRASLARVAAAGYLAPYLMVRPDGWSKEFFGPVCGWLDAHDIPLHENNYIPFYSVYALLSGSMRHDLLRGRRVLVVTHLTDARRQGIDAGLRAEGVAGTEYLGISANASLFEELDLSGVCSGIDIALVAAGIGSVNILDQLKPLGVPCIDCGILIECLIEPQRRWDRPFLIGRDRAAPDAIRAHRKF